MAKKTLDRPSCARPSALAGDGTGRAQLGHRHSPGDGSGDRAADALARAIDRATGFTGTENAEDGTEKGEKGTPAERRDYVEEAYTCFIKDAGDIDPTDPVKAIEAYFQKNATDELKARCRAEGKDANGCWKFIEAVARKALRGSSGHIDPAVVYAIAMHWFEDVPADWDKAAKRSSTVKAMPKPTTANFEYYPGMLLERRVYVEYHRWLMRELKKKERAKAKAMRPKNRQGFFFEMLETPVTTPEEESEVKE